MQPSPEPAKPLVTAERPTATEQPPEAGRVQSAACLNCGTALAGPFCSACGQRDIPPYPSLRELVVDAFWELSGWDGRFAQTVRALVRRPGMLTREFLEGRRARYVSPLRLYLMASLAYFVLAAAAPDLERPLRRARGGVSVGGLNVRIESDAKTRTPRASADPNPDPDGRKRYDELSPEERAAAREEIERQPALIRPFLWRVFRDPEGLKRDVLQTSPRMFFILLPVFASIVALFYRGRRYPEHLYFSIHLHAFVFLALAVPELASFTRAAVLADAVGFVVTIGIPIYATVAFRRVYGGSLVRTLAKEAGIAAIYGLAALLAFIAMLYWVSMVGGVIG